MIELLVISLLVLCGFTYKIFDKDISSPSFLFTIGFSLCSIGAYTYRKEWGLGLGFQTYILIIGGASLFILTEFLYKKTHKPFHKNIDVTKDPVIPIKDYKLVIFLLFQIIAYYLLAKYKFSQSIGAESVGESIGDINQRSKMEHENFFVPWYIQYPYQMCRDTGYIWICLFSYYLYKSKRFLLKKWLLGLNLAICVIGGGYVSGGRMPFLGYLIPLILFIYLFSRYKQKWKKQVFQIRFFIIMLLVAVLFVTSFVKIGYLMGRKESENTNSYVLAVYCGAQIKNLDDFLNSSIRKETELFGGQTFKHAYKDIYKNSAKKSFEQGFSELFNTYRGYPLGNVYTCYYPYYYDFNMFGLLCVVLMSFLLSFLNRKIHDSNFFRTGELNLSVLLYASFISSTFLSFFSEAFFSKIGLIALFKSLVFWLFCKIYLQGFKKTKISIGNKRVL